MREETKDCSGATVSRAHAAVKLVTRHSSLVTRHASQPCAKQVDCLTGTQASQACCDSPDHGAAQRTCDRAQRHRRHIHLGSEGAGGEVAVQPVWLCSWGGQAAPHVQALVESRHRATSAAGRAVAMGTTAGPQLGESWHGQSEQTWRREPAARDGAHGAMRTCRATTQKPSTARPSARRLSTPIQELRAHHQGRLLRLPPQPQPRPGLGP